MIVIDTFTQLQNIFNDVQECDSRKFTDNMNTALALIDKDNSFLHIIDIIICNQRAAIPQKVSHLMRRIFEELYETKKDVLRCITVHLLDKTDCKNTKVRKNTLKLLGLVLSIEKEPVDTSILARIAERLFDKEQSVRSEALKICLSFQNYSLNGTLTIQTTVKDIIRYDPSHEIRKLGFLGLEFNASTLNCILERSIDSNMTIRKAFWTQYFPHVNIKDLSDAQKVFLMKKGIGEREFDAKSIFLQKIRDYGVEQFVNDFYCDEVEYDICIKSYLEDCYDSYELNQYTPSYLHFLVCYYQVKEEKMGRDSLNLIPLEEFLQIFYLKCKEIETLHKNSEITHLNFNSIKYFLRILSFYDLFVDESKKYAFSIITHLICSLDLIPLVEECILFLIKTSSNDLIKVIGSLIKKTKGKQICYTLCEYTMKHLPFGDIHDAIMKEIVVLDLEKSLNTLFWYFIKNPIESVETQYLSFLPSKSVVEGCVDLVLKDLLDKNKIENCLLTQLSRFNETAVEPTCKLLLGKKVESTEICKYLLLIFYSTECNRTQQYLSLFFFEYFRNSPQALLDSFCNVLQLISANHKVFIDQAVFWLSNSAYSYGLQSLYFNVCVFINNNYDTLTNKKQFFTTLTSIPVQVSWNACLTKKIITVLGLLIRKRPRENVNMLLAQILEIDDGTPLTSNEFEELKSFVNFN